ncbi:MAG: hypothetical protein OXG79_07675 [Chloroflexi bacterium]|nr:hypothetical protein [Chloroflexota bacterium]
MQLPIELGFFADIRSTADGEFSVKPEFFDVPLAEAVVVPVTEADPRVVVPPSTFGSDARAANLALCQMPDWRVSPSLTMAQYATLTINESDAKSEMASMQSSWTSTSVVCKKSVNLEYERASSPS